MLGEAIEVAPRLAGGVVNGYLFQMVRGAGTGGEFDWAAVAYPVEPGNLDRVFFINHWGRIYSSAAMEPVAVDPRTCEVPFGFVPFGVVQTGIVQNGFNRTSRPKSAGP